MSSTAKGHIVIRRKAKDGADGSRGAKLKFITYASGQAYQSGAPGEEFYHIAFHTTYQQFFTCIKSYPASETHAPTQSGSNAYWMYEPALTNLFVDILCANEAFLNNLVVRHMYTTDGKCQILEGGVLKAIGAYFQDVKVLGTMRSPFVRHDGSISWDDEKSMAMLHDNLLMAGGGSWTLAAGGLPWDAGQNGRRMTITTHRYNGTLSQGAVSFDAPSGKYFFEDGLLKSKLTMASREYVEMLGIGEDSTFYGWLITNRGNIETNGKFGRMQRVLANGTVRYTGNGSTHSLNFNYKTFDDSTMYAYCSSSTGRYQITLPSGWGLSASDYMVMLTPYGKSYGTSSECCLKATLVDQNSQYFYVETSDDDSNNWGGGFNFQIINLNDWFNNDDND